jgi:sugar phosphate isomerase/epimerase
MNRISRRSLIKNSILMAAGAACFGGENVLGLPQTAISAPDIHFPTAPNERLAVASWPFRTFINGPHNEDRDNQKPGMDLLEFAVNVKKRFGVPGVEPLSAHFPSTDLRYLEKFRAATDRVGVRVVDIPVDNSDSYYSPDPDVRKRAVKNGKKWIDVATILGSPNVRTSIARVRDVKPDAVVAAEPLRVLADYAGSKNVVLNLENDDLVCEDAFFIVKLIETVNHPYLHALPDFCNSMLTGDEQFNYKAVAAMFTKAFGICHVKDSEVGEDKRVYRVDLKKTFGILKAGGYRGYCSMEFEGEGDPYEGTEKLIKASLQELG